MGKLRAVLLGGLVAGVLDIIYAFIVYGPLSYGMTPVQVLQSVAGGWIGREVSSAGGMETALLGLGTHFMIATIFAAVFVIAASALPALKRNAILWGLIYGFGLYIVMNYIVVPLSAAATGHFPADMADATARLQEAFSALRPKDPYQLAGTIFTHTVLVGLPLAWINKRYA